MNISALHQARPRVRQAVKASDAEVEPFATAGMLMLTEKASLTENPFLLDLGSEINQASTQSILSQLLSIGRWFESTEPAKYKPVRIICNCIGGDLVGMLAIIDQLDSLKAKGATIATYVTGEAASGAAVIASHGTRGHRYIAPRAHMMLHQASINGDGRRKPVHEGHSVSKHGLALNQMMLDILADNLKGKTSRQKLDADTQYSLFLNAKQAIDYGLADKIGVPMVEPFDANA